MKIDTEVPSQVFIQIQPAVSVIGNVSIVDEGDQHVVVIRVPMATANDAEFVRDRIKYEVLKVKGR